MKLKIKKLTPSAETPTRGSDGAAGWDLYCTKIEIYNVNQLKASTGIAVEIPPGHVGLLFPRSSIVKTGMRLGNSVGVIDSDYRGEITAVFDVQTRYEAANYRIGDRIVQLVIVPYVEFDGIEVCEKLSRTERGTGGYGSTGR